MEWVKAHPFATALGAVGLLIMIGSVFVESRLSAVPKGELTIWGGSGAPLLNPTSYDATQASSNAGPQLGAGSSQPVYIPPSKQTDTAAGGSDTFDMNAFIAELSRPPKTAGGTSTQADVSLAYSFIPSGLIATTTPARRLSRDEQKIYEYGNEAASYIQTFEESTQNAPTILRDQIEDRTSAEKAARVKAVAAAMKEAATGLGAMENIPAAIKPLHDALANSYNDLAAKLAKVPDAQSDQQLIGAITEYNNAADSFAKVYIAIATYFSTAGIVFSPQDPGSIFVFSGGSGL